MSETVLLTPDDLAARWQRRVEWVRDNAADFGGIKIGGSWRFHPDDVERYEQRHKTSDPLSMTALAAKRRERKK